MSSDFVTRLCYARSRSWQRLTGLSRPVLRLIVEYEAPISDLLASAIEHDLKVQNQHCPLLECSLPDDDGDGDDAKAETKQSKICWSPKLAHAVAFRADNDLRLIDRIDCKSRLMPSWIVEGCHGTADVLWMTLDLSVLDPATMRFLSRRSDDESKAAWLAFSDWMNATLRSCSQARLVIWRLYRGMQVPYVDAQTLMQFVRQHTADKQQLHVAYFRKVVTYSETVFPAKAEFWRWIEGDPTHTVLYPDDFRD